MAGPYGAITSVVYITGTSTAMTNEACSLVSGKIYQITDTSKRVIDPTVAVVVKDNGVTVDAANYTINFMFGKVTFAVGYTPTTPITISSANYLPLKEVTTAKGFTIDDETELPDATVFHATETCKQCMPTLRDCSGSLTRLDAGEQDYDSGAGEIKLRDLLINATAKVLAITFGSSTLSWRGMVMFDVDSIKMDPKGVIEGTVNWSSYRSEATTIDSGSTCAWNYSED